MTIKEFMERHSIKNKDTVRVWIKNGDVPGADYEADFIPDRAKPPYYRARAKKPGAIYVSIVRSLVDGYRPIPFPYKTITEDEFYNVYMASLIRSNYIIEVPDNELRIVDYYPSEKAQAYVLGNDRELLSRIKTDLGTIGTIIGHGKDFLFSFFNA